MGGLDDPKTTTPSDLLEGGFSSPPKDDPDGTTSIEKVCTNIITTATTTTTTNSSDHNNNGHNTMNQRMEDGTTKIRLLVHTVDGCIPYLNPSQLEVHFPPSDDFWIGLAVRDTCVLPVFEKYQQGGKPSKTKTKKDNHIKNMNTTKSSNGDDDLDDGAGVDGVDEVIVVDTGTRKARGYTFADVKPDPWLLPYTRLTVPAFDVIQDGDTTTRKVTKEIPTTKNGKSKGPSNTKEGNNHVLVWTPHGRQKLTPDLYSKAALGGLQSQHTVSLFEMTDEWDDKKRIAKVKIKNQNWLHHLIECAHSGRDMGGGIKDDTTTSTIRPSLWAPVLFTNDDEHFIYNDENTSADSLSVPLPCWENEAISGVAFVGRWRSGLSPTIKNVRATWKAILSTQSLSEILNIATERNINVIGTGLPAIWAKKKLALGIAIIADGSLDDGVEGTLPQPRKRPKVEKGTNILDVPLDGDGCMDLTCKDFARDSRPLVMGCSCMACDNGRFSRAYIHHLVCAKELLAEILIFGHNLHTLMKLIRTFNTTNDRNYIKAAIEEQLDTITTSDTIT